MPVKLEIRLLGGFEVSLGGEPVSGFESQNVRALIAYLACHPGRELSRSALASLLWSEEDETTALRNLRQALYNLRSVLERAGCEQSPIQISHRTLRLEPDAVDLDILLFAESLRLGRSGDTVDATHLARAAQLYTGDFMAGFYLRDSPELEIWMLGEQERLRELAVAALRDLVQHHTHTGGFPLGLQCVRQLLRIEPFSEEAHRQLIYLYALSGRRSRALNHYEELCRLFDRELGVEPLPETQQLVERIQEQTLPPPTDVAKAEATGPWIPLVAREQELVSLRAAWTGVGRGAGRLTLVEGEAGVGKTRLIRTFLHEASRETRTTVLQGRSYELGPPSAFQPIAEALSNVVANDIDIAERMLATLPRAQLTALASLVPELVQLDPKLAAPTRRAGSEGRQRLFEAVTAVLTMLAAPARGRRDPQPVILFLDDIQWADASTFELLEQLLPKLQGRPIWIIAAYRAEEIRSPRLHQRLRAAAAGQAGGSRLVVERFGQEAIAEICAALLEGDQAALLADSLGASSEGLPLAVVEQINLLWDEEVLERQASGHWSLNATRDELKGYCNSTVEETVLRRVGRLPTSTRRLLTLAAVAGQKFEAHLLQLAERELDIVIETGLEVMIDHWMVRQFARYWADTRLDRDLALWAPGGLKGTFEFIHKNIRSAVYDRLDPPRAQAIHRQLARALEEIHGPDSERASETLAYHLARGELWDPAIRYCELSARKAQRVFAVETARSFYEEALRLTRAKEQAAASKTKQAAKATAQQRRRLESALADLTA
jgi:DNA-binding SARP family transcriptional activator